VIDGISAALRAGPISSRLILCFLRHLSAEFAMQTLEAALPYRDRIVAVASIRRRSAIRRRSSRRLRARTSEGFLTSRMPEKRRARRTSAKRSRCCAFPASTTACGASRIQHWSMIWWPAHSAHGLSAVDVKLGIFRSIQDHPLRMMLQRGIVATVNSDDPAYFGGYVVDNYLAVASALGCRKRKCERWPATPSKPASCPTRRRRPTFGTSSEHERSA